MKKRLIGFCLAILISFTFLLQVSAQLPESEDYTPEIKERLFYGGNFGVSFGRWAYVDIEPVVGYWLLPRLGIAAGPTFKYMKDHIGSTDVWGGRAFTRFVVIHDINNVIPLGVRMGLYLHLEYEQLSYRSDFFYISFPHERVNEETVFAGVGVSQYIGQRTSLNFSVLWILNETVLDVYNNPEFRIGITF